MNQIDNNSVKAFDGDNNEDQLPSIDFNPIEDNQNQIITLSNDSIIS